MTLPEITTFDEARQIIREQAEEIEKLSNELAWFKRQMFGSQTEHYILRCYYSESFQNMPFY